MTIPTNLGIQLSVSLGPEAPRSFSCAIRPPRPKEGISHAGGGGRLHRVGGAVARRIINKYSYTPAPAHIVPYMVARGRDMGGNGC